MLLGVLRGGRRTASKFRSTCFSFICSPPATWPARSFASATTPQGNEAAEPIGSSSLAGELKFRKAKSLSPRLPTRRTQKQSNTELTRQAFLDDLESCLPVHLRRSVAADKQVATRDASKLAKVLLAHRAGNPNDGTLLLDLAVFQRRWRAAVWIVKQLLEQYHKADPKSSRLMKTVQHWTRSESLDSFTHQGFFSKPPDGQEVIPHIATSRASSLDDLTNEVPEELSSVEKFRHDILGVVWQGIGEMIIACVENPSIAAGEVRPEILEMIAMLHHHELMPSSIYTYLPSESDDAIQQPPTLHLLSARILTALSDAAWRAHEMTVVEEAKKSGSHYYATRPELAGSSYRVRVSGVKPEIWLELILWSCLHGGWVKQGAELLKDVCSVSGEAPWHPISWRDCLRAIMPFGKSDLLDWDAIKHMYDTTLHSAMDEVDITGLRVDRTVSSEVVNAYIDGLLNIMYMGVGSRGLGLDNVLRHLRRFRSFLANSGLNLGGGTWDAVMVRIVESGSLNVDRGSGYVPRLVELLPVIGEEVQSQRSQSLPPYVLDGSAVALGLLHRTLRAHIRQGNLDGALRAFRTLQERVDSEKNRSLLDFFHNRRPASSMNSASPDVFTSNFTGIDYPAFETQIPATTLASFLELVTTNKAYEFGRWLLYSEDVDGPVISESRFRDPALAPALIRFATSINDMDLLNQIVKARTQQAEEERPRLPHTVLQAFLDAQIQMRRWDAAKRILEYMRDTLEYTWNSVNVAMLMKAMLLESIAAPERGSQTEAFASSHNLLKSLLKGDFTKPNEGTWTSRTYSLRFILSTLHPRWANMMNVIRPPPKLFSWLLPASVFNHVLDGALHVNGATAGQRLVETFWKDTKPDFSSRSRDDAPDSGEVERMPRFLRDVIQRKQLTRSIIEFPSRESGELTKVAMYGSLWPDSATFRLIYTKALEEYRDQSTPTNQVIQILHWTLESLRRLRVGLDGAYAAIRATLSEEDFRALKMMDHAYPGIEEEIESVAEGGDNVDSSAEVKKMDHTYSRVEEEIEFVAAREDVVDSSNEVKKSVSRQSKDDFGDSAWLNDLRHGRRKSGENKEILSRPSG